jgi:polyhydroxyalkanoate synthase
VTVCGRPLDFTSINCPVYYLACRDDHIVPWRGAWRSAELLRGERRFVLSGSGHIAGVINPPATSRRGFIAGDYRPGTADAWLESKTENKGSWWPDWSAWLAQRSPSRRRRHSRLGNRRYPVVDAAPGRYVMERAIH